MKRTLSRLVKAGILATMFFGAVFAITKNMDEHIKGETIDVSIENETMPLGLQPDSEELQEKIDRNVWETTGQKIRMKGCEDWKRREPQEADC